ncbi:hypothetical protein FisN_19Lh124 [Fistulifera solaris]|uniref:Uncharacterized protein n=1 Tax=Fistulifera solaris TaxID=1519565 RepID=A0A1Z5J6T5_FISSO|nr:hypothetical protein FisN_19Lh124 [Fistulifera solaris]|eukprot:GAX09659.1 hypothetical protein FisN_19Lh124 [Fistulifera solaris]
MSSQVVVSRRLWIKHAHRFQNNTNDVTAKITPDEKPWPKNWIRFFYVSAGTLIPYFGLWFVSSNTTLRDMLLPVNDESSAFMKWVRAHYGQEDVHAASYCDNTEKEYRLLDELSAAERAQEQQKQKMDQQKIHVNVGFVTEHMGAYHLATEMKEHTLPGSLLANAETIKDTLMGIRKDDALEIMTGSPVVTFVDDDAADESSSNVSDTIIEASLMKPNDPLFQTHYAMSSWQVVDPAMIPEKQKNPSATTSWEEIERQRLEYELLQLQDEIRKGSTRSVDDVREELNRVQTELRRRSWKRWLSWN